MFGKQQILHFIFDRYFAWRVDEYLPELLRGTAYCADGLAVWRKDVAFMRDPRFLAAYAMGMNSGHKIGRPKGSDIDIHIEWRVAICCWAAKHASHLGGDFVECGVNTGMLSLAVCNYINFNSLNRNFYLFDTYDGIPPEQITDAEARVGRGDENSQHYEECYDVARRNFAGFPRAKLIRGKVPDTLSTVKIDKIAYLSIDMNVALPERAAIEYFWPKLVPGGIVILDDYGWINYPAQKATHDEFAAREGVDIFLLPTGQGLLLKP